MISNQQNIKITLIAIPVMLMLLTSNLAAQDRPEVIIIYHDNQQLADHAAEKVADILYQINQNHVAGELRFSESDLVAEAFNRGLHFMMNSFSGYLHDYSDHLFLINGIYLGTENPDYDPVQELQIYVDENGRFQDFQLIPESEHIVTYLLSDQNVSAETNRLAYFFLSKLEHAYRTKNVELLNRLIPEMSLIQASVMTDDLLYYRFDSGRKYLNSMQRIFLVNDVIDVRYSDVEVFQYNQTNANFMIKARQIWTSNHYRDEGYVSFILKDEQNQFPKMLRRGWYDSKIAVDDYLVYQELIRVEEVPADTVRPIVEIPDLPEPVTGIISLKTGHEGLHLMVSGEFFDEQFNLTDGTRDVELEPGIYELFVIKEGFQPFQTVAEVTAGDVVEFEILLEKEQSGLSRRIKYIVSGGVLAVSVAVTLLSGKSGEAVVPIPDPPGRPN